MAGIAHVPRLAARVRQNSKLVGPCEGLLRKPSRLRNSQAKITSAQRPQKCFAVGVDRIGDYRERDGKWQKRSDYETSVELTNVLRLTGITRIEYDEYIELLDALNAYEVASCRDFRDSGGPWVRVITYVSGISVSGCIGSIEWYDSFVPTSSGGPDESYFEQVEALDNGWFAILHCT